MRRRVAMDAPGPLGRRLPGLGRAAASTWRPAGGERPGRVLRVPADGAAATLLRRGSRSAATSSRVLPAPPAASRPLRASARRWSPSAPWRPVSPTRSTTRPPRRRARSTACEETLTYVSSTSLRAPRRATASRPSSSAPSTRCGSRPSRQRRVVRRAGRRRPRGGAHRLAGRRTASSATGCFAPALAAAGVDDRVVRPGRSTAVGPEALEPALEWVAAHASARRAPRRGARSRRGGSPTLVGCGEVVLAAGPGVACSASTSPRASRARW